MTRRRMDSVGILSTMFVFAALAASGPAEADSHEGSLVVHVAGLRSRLGKVGCALFASPAGFPQNPSVASQTRWCPIAKDQSTCTFDPISPGRYAVACFHDENDNNRCDTGLFGIPTEDIVVSNHARGFLAPPTFQAAAFTTNGSPLELRLSIGH